MSLTLSFHGETLEEINKKIHTHLGAVPPAGEVKAKPTAAKPKADAPKETVAEAVVAAVAPAPDLFGEDKPAAPKVTKKELIAKMTAVTGLEKEMTTAKKLLADFGATKLSDVAEARWSEFVSACDKALGK